MTKLLAGRVGYALEYEPLTPLTCGAGSAFDGERWNFGGCCLYQSVF